ncbi:MAG: SPL family radical SAM protein [Planctomycetota bacterium]|jgi:spore photoproduct lyase
MDTARTFKPETILLWQKVAEHPEAGRILGLFPSAQVRLIERQRSSHSPEMSPSQALLAGKKTLMIGETSSFVGRFDGRLGSTVRCCPYYKLVPLSNGCPYYCTYCYLAFVYRNYAPFIKININYDAMFRQIRKALARTGGKVSFNMGEMLDSLALDHITDLTTMLVPFFSGLSRGFLMLLTKSSNIDNLLAVEPNDQTVVSWSLNSQQMIEEYELGTAGLAERIEAARRCQGHGYRIRIRIDPGILHPGWKAGYADLIQQTLTAVSPENITLGMLRLVPGHSRLAAGAYGNAARKLWSHNFVAGASDGKLRYPAKERVAFYTFLIDAIRSFDKDVSISLCRETPKIWSIFKDRLKPRKCNCVAW